MATAKKRLTAKQASRLREDAALEARLRAQPFIDEVLDAMSLLVEQAARKCLSSVSLTRPIDPATSDEDYHAIVTGIQSSLKELGYSPAINKQATLTGYNILVNVSWN